MAKITIKAGTTSKLVDLFIQDSSSTTGAGLTGLAYNTGSLTAYYYREGAASATAISLATMTLGTWATSGFVVIDGTNLPGCYQLGLPDAAIAAGASSVIVMLKGAANMAPCVLEIQLTGADIGTLTSAEETAIADALLKRDMSAVSGESARSPLNALRFLRNKWSISGSTLTVTKEDDSASAWTSALTATPGVDPITASDPG